jgi:hypothetical protein
VPRSDGDGVAHHRTLAGRGEGSLPNRGDPVCRAIPYIALRDDLNAAARFVDLRLRPAR